MNQFVIHFVGICMFMIMNIGGVTNARRVYLPDASTAQQYQSKAIEAHNAYIAVDETSVDQQGSTWTESGSFPALGVRFKYFTLSGVTLSTNAEDLLLDTVDQDGKLPHLTDWCPGYTPDSTKLVSHSAATLDITKGILSADGNIDKDEAVVSNWTVSTSQNLVITATENGSIRTLSIKPGSLIYVGNQPPDAMKWISNNTVSNHFLLYYIDSRTACDATLYPHMGTSLPMHGSSPKATMIDDGRGLHADCSNSNYP